MYQDRGNQGDRRAPTEHTFERRKNDEPRTADRLPPREPLEIKKSQSGVLNKQSS